MFHIKIVKILKTETKTILQFFLFVFVLKSNSIYDSSLKVSKTYEVSIKFNQEILLYIETSRQYIGKASL